MSPAYRCEELTVSAAERAAGTDRRWWVIDAETGGQRLVELPRRTPGRWSEAPRLICACGIDNCLHRACVRDALEHEHTPTPPLAA